MSYFSENGPLKNAPMPPIGPDGTMTHMAVMSTLGKCDWFTWPNPAGIYLFKAPIGNTTTMCKICLKLTIRSPERRLSGVFKQISCIVWCFHYWLSTSKCRMGTPFRKQNEKKPLKNQSEKNAKQSFEYCFLLWVWDWFN